MKQQTTWNNTLTYSQKGFEMTSKAIFNCVLVSGELWRLKQFRKKKDQCRWRGQTGTALKLGRKGDCFGFQNYWAMIVASEEPEDLRRRTSFLFPEVLAHGAVGSCAYDLWSVGPSCGLLQAQVFSEWATHERRKAFQVIRAVAFSILFHLHSVLQRPLLPALLAPFWLFWNDACPYLGEHPQRLSHPSFLLWASVVRCPGGFVLVATPTRNSRAIIWGPKKRNRYYSPLLNHNLL